jgi:sensor histidine kinase regulating citrate/malate metabolism
MSPELTALVVVLTLILQTWYQRWASKGDKEEVKAEAKAQAKAVAVKTEVTAQAVTEKLETVHRAMNGEGIGGKLDEIRQWQEAHDAQDNLRYDGLLTQILGLKAAAERKPPDMTPQR